MSYVLPSVLVYQQLANAGGVANISPDLDACIVGPAKNVIDFKSSNAAALSKSLSYTFDYKTTATGLATVPATFEFNVPSTKPGQLVDVDSLEVWFHNVTTQTHQETITASADTDLISFASAPAALTSGEAALKVGDQVVIRQTAPSNVTNAAFLTTIREVMDADTIRISNIYKYSAGVLSAATSVEITVYRTVADLQSSNVAAASFATVATTGTGTATTANFASANGKIVKAELHVEYTAVRTDVVGIKEFGDVTEAEAYFENTTDKNPLGLAVKLAFANTITTVKAIAVESNDLAGYATALELAEGDEKIYSLVPLTQDEAIIAAFNSHTAQMSVPQYASWRMSIVNTAIPSTSAIAAVADVVSRTLGGGVWILEKFGAEFLTLGIRAGDTIALSAGTPAMTGTLVVDTVLNNDQIKIVGVTTAATGVNLAVTRKLTKSDQAGIVAAKSEAFGSSRVVHIQPDLVGVEVGGVVKSLPGYYLSAALAGAISGFPVQQGLTNISLAGISDLGHSNFYFTRSQLDSMAEKGTCLYTQVAQGSAPYCRHELTTDMSVLAYREILKVKNVDYLSKYFHNLMKPFIGKWNITDDTLSIMRQTIIAACEQLKSRKLPRIGAPLVAYRLKKLAQNEFNKDNVDIELEVATADPNNYTNVYLII